MPHETIHGLNSRVPAINCWDNYVIGPVVEPDCLSSRHNLGGLLQRGRKADLIELVTVDKAILHSALLVSAEARINLQQIK
eukprot:104329-Rhodomonas_salina.1